MQGERVRKYLREQGIAFEEMQHPRVVDAQTLAHLEHESGWRIAKTVMLRLGSKLTMAVVPAPVRVDLRRIREGMQRQDVRLASETEYAGAFPDCEVGAEPPFGNLYGMQTLIDRTLLEDPYLVFRDGTHRGTLKVGMSDYLRAANGIQLDMGILPPNIPKETTLWGESY
jgi:Ala-tRNA(Pro) deacylase